MENKEPTKQNLFDLIEKITPLNNRYRDLIKGFSNGTEILVLMWEVGDLIQSFTNKFQVKPHNLYWKIYGKAEGLKTSYITRDFLSYCLRIRNYFSSAQDIPIKFPHLQRYSLFREAFPLLENPKFKLSKSEELEILKILNSKANCKKIKTTIQEIKANRIGIKNTRTQRLNEMKPITDNVVEIYNEIYQVIKGNDRPSVDKIIDNLSKDLLVIMSQGVSALTQENLYVPELKEYEKLPDQWKKFIENLKYLLESSVETRNRFRRLFPPRKLFDLADMLNALTTEKGISNYRKRKNIN